MAYCQTQLTLRRPPHSFLTAFRSGTRAASMDGRHAHWPRAAQKRVESNPAVGPLKLHLTRGASLIGRPQSGWLGAAGRRVSDSSAR